MSRKTLLTETEIRQFLKLANLGGVGDTRIREMFGTDELSEEDEIERELDATEDELGAEDAFADEEAGELDDMELDTDVEVPEASGDEQLVSVDDFMGALESALEDALGEPVEVEMDAAPDEGEDVALDMDVEEPSGDLELDMDIEDEEPGMRDMYENQDALVQEVARRVAARLQKKNNQQEMVDQLAEKIMKRLTQ